MAQAFKEQLVSKIIPGVRELIRKEVAHIEHLKSRKRFLVDLSLVNKYIAQSEAYLAHYKLRLRQYVEYSKTL